MTDFSRLEKFVLLSMKATFPEECKEVQSYILEDTILKLEKRRLVVLGEYNGALLTRKGLEAALDIDHAQAAATVKKTECYARPHYCTYCGNEGITSGGFSGGGTIYKCGECGRRFVVERGREELGNQ